MATLDRTNPIAVPTGLSAVSPMTISPATVPSTMITASGAPTLRTLFGSPGYVTTAG